MMPVFKLHNVVKSYGRRDVVNIEEFTIPSCQIYTLLGPNGSGKTTLMRIMALLTRNDNGSLKIWDEEINWGKGQLLRLRRQMTMVTQTAFMFDGTVYANVAYGLKARKIEDRQIRASVEKSLELVGMNNFVNADTRGLSGGERQKVAIARALAVEPKVLFLDEPTSNIDPQSAVEIEQYIKFINRELGVTIIMVTHNIFQARRLADEIFFMWDGKIIEKGKQEIFTHAVDERARAFLKGDTFF